MLLLYFDSIIISSILHTGVLQLLSFRILVNKLCVTNLHQALLL